MTVIYDTVSAMTVGDIELESCWASAWTKANINGTSDVAYGVSSITDVGTGKIGINLSRAFANTNYVAICLPVHANTGLSKTMTQVTVNLSTTRSDFEYNSAIDPEEWSVLFYGDY